MDRAARYGVAVVAVDLLPVPLLDTVLQNRLRRRLVRGEAAAAGVVLSDEAVLELADEPVLDLWRLLTWPVRKLVGKVLWPVSVAWTFTRTLTIARRAREAPPALPGA